MLQRSKCSIYRLALVFLVTFLGISWLLGVLRYVFSPDVAGTSVRNALGLQIILRKVERQSQEHVVAITYEIRGLKRLGNGILPDLGPTEFLGPEYRKCGPYYTTTSIKQDSMTVMCRYWVPGSIEKLSFRKQVVLDDPRKIKHCMFRDVANAAPVGAQETNGRSFFLANVYIDRFVFTGDFDVQEVGANDGVKLSFHPGKTGKRGIAVEVRTESNPWLPEITGELIDEHGRRYRTSDTLSQTQCLGGVDQRVCVFLFPTIVPRHSKLDLEIRYRLDYDSSDSAWVEFVDVPILEHQK